MIFFVLPEIGWRGSFTKGGTYSCDWDTYGWDGGGKLEIGAGGIICTEAGTGIGEPHEEQKRFASSTSS